MLSIVSVTLYIPDKIHSTQSILETFTCRHQSNVDLLNGVLRSFQQYFSYIQGSHNFLLAKFQTFSRLFPGFFSKFKVFRNRKTRNAKPFESYFLTYIPCFNEKLRFKEHSNSMIVISFLYLASYKTTNDRI